MNGELHVKNVLMDMKLEKMDIVLIIKDVKKKKMGIASNVKMMILMGGKIIVLMKYLDA